jgi:tetratricopeptide (TPR) repeat protein
VRVGVLAAVLATLSFVGSARAAGDDAAALQTVTQVLNEDYSQASFGEAKKKLAAASDRCKKGKCTASTRARIHVALGMVASQVGQADEAKAEFIQALTDDPNAKLPDSGTTPNIRNQWADALKTAAPPPPPPPPQPDPTPTPSGTPAKIPGWNSVEAFQLASAALASGKAGKFDECIENDKKSLELEEQPRTRLHLGYCEQQAGKLIDALKDTAKALEEGIRKNDRPLKQLAAERVQELVKKIPHVTFVPPPGVGEITVTFDDRPVATEHLGKKFSIDPGHHKVHAEGAAGAVTLAFDEEYDVKEGELLTVNITLKAQTSEYLTPGQLKCMLAAKSQEDVLKCLPENKKNLVVKAGFDVSSYTDTNAVNIFTPSINGSVSSPTAGWNVGASYLLDVVTAASPDVVSMASRAFRDRRHAVGLGGGYKRGIFGVQGTGNLSTESDYTSGGVGVAVTADLRDKTITPRLAYRYGHDVIGRVGTPFDVWSRTLDIMDFEAGVTMVVSAKTILLLSGSLTTERGDQSKPYRFIPVFPADTFGGGNPPLRLPAGASIDLVNAYRLPLKPIEQLPTSRDRWAVGMRFAHRITANATLRLEQRIYRDTWGLTATTTDARYVMDVGKRLRVWPHARFNAQTGVSFYAYPYTARLNTDGSIELPLFRTSDRELSPLLTFTLGGGARIALTPPDSKVQFGLSFAGDVMYTRFLNAMYVTQRTAVYGTLGVDAEFD